MRRKIHTEKCFNLQSTYCVLGVVQSLAPKMSAYRNSEKKKNMTKFLLNMACPFLHDWWPY